MKSQYFCSCPKCGSMWLDDKRRNHCNKCENTEDIHIEEQLLLNLEEKDAFVG